MSADRDPHEARRAELVARAEADRERLRQRLEPVLKLDRAFERLRDWKLDVPAAGLGTGLALSALMLALPAGRSPIVRGGIALVQLAASVKRLFSHASGRA